MKKLLFGLGLLMPFLLSAQQVARSLTASNGTFIGFYEYKPPTYSASSSAKSPMIIFLHGIGERGDGSSTLSSVLNVGIPRNIHYGLTNMVFNYNGSQQGFVVLSPQLSYNYGNWQPFYIQEMIKYAKNNLNVDTNRIYLTGLSLGGGGVWNYASSSAGAAKGLAAIAPICGTCDWSGLNNIAQQALPVWAFHAMDDGVVGVGCTQAALSGINSYNPSVAPIATYYPTGNHWIWDQVYDPANPQLYLWFLSKSRGSSAPPPPPSGGNVAPVANAGNAQTITLPTNSVNLSGSGSYDQDGTITNYTWSQVSGPGTASFVNPNASNTSVGGLIAGSYVFKLTVTDNGGLTNSSNVTITVNQQAAPANQPPVAVASANQTITLPTNSVFLLGSGSYDPGGGYITNYTWTQQSGPNTATTTVVSNTNLDVKNLVAGTYVFKLTVTDNQGATGSTTTQVTVNGGTTTTVVANAGSNQSLTLPTNSTTLNGSGSTGATTYSWIETAGPTQANISGWNTATPTVSNMVAGTYAFKLTVSNSAGASSSAEVQVVVNGNSAVSGNQPPVASAGSNQSLILPTNSTFLYGSGSYDPGGGSITNYQWSQQSGPSNATITAISTTNVEVKNMIAGIYVFKLVVTDNQGATGSATVQVTVTGTTPPPPPPSGGNTPPVAVPGANQTITLPTNSVFLQGSGSYDPGGWITGYDWVQQSGPNQATINYLSSSNIEVKNMIAGTYVFHLTVEDNGGATASATVTVTVNGTSTPTGGSSNTPPVSVAGSTQWITLPTNSVYLMGSGSYDPGGWITNYAWSQVSGPNTATLTTISPTNVEAKNLIAGTYTFRLTVTDNGGATGTSTMQVVVNSSGARTASATPTTTTEPVSSTSLVNYAVSTTSTTADKTVSTNSLVLYPNPVSTTMTVQVNNSITGDLQISIMSASGIAVKTIRATKSSQEFTQQVNMQDVPQGTYVVEIRFADGTRMTGQVIKR